MSCSCQTQQNLPTSPTGECLPTLEEACAVAKSTTLCATCAADSDCLNQDKSDGTTLANSWLDACCKNENVTLLGRVGNKLARFTQSGFIKLVNGKASVVSSIPLKVSTLWHRYWRPTDQAVPILGEPLPFSYLTVLDENGTPHAQKGSPDGDSALLWDVDTERFVMKPIDEFFDAIVDDVSTIPNFVTIFNTALTD